jgi:hypothetical protein
VVLVFFAQAIVALAPWLPVVAWLGSWGEDLLWSVGRAVAGDEWELGLRARWRMVVGTLAPLHGGRAGAVVPPGDRVVPCFEATSTMLGILEVFSAVSKQIAFQLAPLELLALQTLQFKLSFLNFPHQLALQPAFTSSCGDIVASWSVMFPRYWGRALVPSKSVALIWLLEAASSFGNRA